MLLGRQATLSAAIAMNCPDQDALGHSMRNIAQDAEHIHMYHLGAPEPELEFCKEAGVVEVIVVEVALATTVLFQLPLEACL